MILKPLFPGGALFRFYLAVEKHHQEGFCKANLPPNLALAASGPVLALQTFDQFDPPSCCWCFLSVGGHRYWVGGHCFSLRLPIRYSGPQPVHLQVGGGGFGAAGGGDRHGGFGGGLPGL